MQDKLLFGGENSVKNVVVGKAVRAKHTRCLNYYRLLNGRGNFDYEACIKEFYTLVFKINSHFCSD